MLDASDDELYILYLENNEYAYELLYKKYRRVISYYLKKYFLNAKYLNISLDDLSQDALDAFNYALMNYKQNSDASLYTFICNCINKKIMSRIRDGKRYKRIINTNSLSLDYIYGDDLTLEDCLSSDEDILKEIIEQENLIMIMKIARRTLSSFEFLVLKYLLSDYNYRYIANKLNKTPKQIDNTIQRIHRKIKKYYTS